MHAVETIVRIAISGGKDEPFDVNVNPLPKASWSRAEIVSGTINGLRSMGFPWANIATGMTKAGIPASEWIAEALTILQDSESKYGSMAAMVSCVLLLDDLQLESMARVLPMDVVESVAEHLVIADTMKKDQCRERLLNLAM